MKLSGILGICMGAMLLFPAKGLCSLTTDDYVEDGAVVISGDLTYDKVKEALAPLMTKSRNKESSKNIRQIKIDSRFNAVYADFVTIINFVQGSKPSCKVEVPDLLKTMVDIYYENGCVKVKRNKNRRTARNINQYVIVNITAPKLQSLTLKTAGKAAVESLVQTEKLNIDVSAACVAAFNKVECPDVELKVNSASGVTFGSLKTSVLSGNVNSASKLTIDGNIGNLKVTLDGCSQLKAAGKADRASLKLDGVSKAYIKNLKYNDISTTVNGLSRIEYN